MTILYTTGCPKCKILEAKLKQKGINYTECNDIEEMEKKGLQSAPALEVDGELMEFVAAIKWTNRLGELV